MDSFAISDGRNLEQIPFLWEHSKDKAQNVSDSGITLTIKEDSTRALSRAALASNTTTDHLMNSALFIQLCQTKIHLCKVWFLLFTHYCDLHVFQSHLVKLNPTNELILDLNPGQNGIWGMALL